MKSRAFVLFELVIALSILTTVLVFSQQWWLRHQRTQQLQNDVHAAEVMLNAIDRFWLTEQRRPNDLPELISKGYVTELWQPWPEPWQLSYNNGLLRLAIQAPSTNQARALAHHLTGADVSARDELRLHVWQPLPVVLNQRFLQRVADPAHPEYQQMETHLDLNGNAIRNVSRVDADIFNGTSVYADLAEIKQLRSDSTETIELVSDNAIIGGFNVKQLLTEFAALQQSWQQCVASGGCR